MRVEGEEERGRVSGGGQREGEWWRRTEGGRVEDRGRVSGGGQRKGEWRRTEGG